MKISKYFSYCLIIVLTCLCFSLSFSNASIKAESDEVSLSIYKNNLSYSSEIYFLYAVQYENIDIDVNEVELLFWDSEQEEYLKGTEKYSQTSVALEEIYDTKCLVFYSKGIDAKSIIDDIYTRAYVKIDEVEYYSEVNITSVVEYIYRVKKAKELSLELDNLFDALLNYGAAAQIKFGYKIDKLANDQFYNISVVNGLVNEQESDVLYKGTNVTINALNKSNEDLMFKYWTDSKGNIVSGYSEYSFEVSKNEEYSANYVETSKVFIKSDEVKEILYGTTFNDLDLPSMYLVEHNGQNVLLDIEWNEADYNAESLEKQILYASLVDESAYEEYGINYEDLKLVLDVFDFLIVLDEETNTYTITDYYGNEADVVIPSEFNGIQINKIKDLAFYECSVLESIEIPSSITYIDSYAFKDCNNLISITVPYIGSTIEDSIGRYFGYLFGATTFLTAYNYIPTSIKEITVNGGAIGENAFIGCVSLETITLSNSIVSINETAFETCPLGMKVYFEGNKEEFEEKIYSGFDQSKAYFIFEFYVQDENGEYYLYNEVDKETLKNIISIEECIDLLLEDLSDYYGTEATKDNVHGISEESSKTMYDFFLTDEKYSELWRWLAEYFLDARYYDGNYSSGYQHLVDNNNSYWRYEVWAFVNQDVRTGWPYSSDYSLEKNKVTFEIALYLVELNNHYYVNHEAKEATCEEAGHSAYVTCARCNYIEGYEEKEALGHTYSEEWTVDVEPTYESVGYKSYHCINEGCESKIDTTEIPILTYSQGLEYELNESKDGYIVAGIGECTDTDIIIPEEHEGLPVLEIKAYAFYGCKSLKSITIPTSVTNIGSNAFQGCTLLESIEIPASVTKIIDYLFYNCTSLKNIEIPNNVTSIGLRAFYNCTSLTSIVIPTSVTNIYFAAFDGCDSLESITIPFVGIRGDGTGNTNFGHIFGAAGYSTNIDYVPSTLKEVIVTGGSVIDARAFEGCKSLTKIVIPNTVTSIGDFAFYGCTSLESITIPFTGEKADETGNIIFGCIFGNSNSSVPTSLKEVIITDGSTIKYSSFYGCTSITSIKIPISVTIIKDYAFTGCTSLESIEISSSVELIGKQAFANCTSLEGIYYNGTLEEWNNVEKNDLLDYFSGNIYIKNNEGEYELYTN